MATVTLTFEVSSPAGLVQAIKDFLGNITDGPVESGIPDLLPDALTAPPVEPPVEPPKRGRRPRAVSSTTPVAPAEPPVAEDDWADDEPAKEAMSGAEAWLLMCAYIASILFTCWAFSMFAQYIKEAM